YGDVEGTRENILKGSIATNNQWTGSTLTLTDDDKIITNFVDYAGRHPNCEMFIIRTIPGITKLYHFLNNDSLDRTKVYRIHDKYSDITYFVKNWLKRNYGRYT